MTKTKSQVISVAELINLFIEDNIEGEKVMFDVG